MRTLPTLILLASLHTASLLAAEPTSSSSVATAPTNLKDLPYVVNGHERQKLDLYLPVANASAPSAPHPLLIWIHGGGWHEGSKKDCPALPLVAKGYAVASIGYRLSQHAVYPAQIEDCKAAIRWLRAHAGEYAIDPKHIGVWGHSAGGHLSALLGTTGDTREFDKGENLDQSSAVECVIDWSGPTDFLHYGEPPLPKADTPDSAIVKLLGAHIADQPEKARKASPVAFANAHSAPFLILQGDRDDLVPVQQSQRLHDALEKAGVECTLKIIPGAGHGGPEFFTPEMIALMYGFCEKHLRPAR